MKPIEQAAQEFAEMLNETTEQRTDSFGSRSERQFIDMSIKAYLAGATAERERIWAETQQHLVETNGQTTLDSFKRIIFGPLPFPDTYDNYKDYRYQPVCLITPAQKARMEFLEYWARHAVAYINNSPSGEQMVNDYFEFMDNLPKAEGEPPKIHKVEPSPLSDEEKVMLADEDYEP